MWLMRSRDRDRRQFQVQERFQYFYGFNRPKPVPISGLSNSIAIGRCGHVTRIGANLFLIYYCYFFLLLFLSMGGESKSD